jgi:hypothetical protein
MIATDFNEKYFMYENMAIWEISSMEDFFKSHNMMKEIFQNEYGFAYSEETAKGMNLIDAGFAVVEKLLDCFRDKHFVVFSDNDENHTILKTLQDKKVIQYGMDIHVLNPNRIYVLEMDKTKEFQKYDT